MGKTGQAVVAKPALDEAHSQESRVLLGDGLAREALDVVNKAIGGFSPDISRM